MNEYTINITNNSGNDQDYAIFNEPPKVTGNVQGAVWSNVYDIASTANQGFASFSIYKQYYAVCGSSHGTPSAGVVVKVSQTKPVTLGSVQDDGASTFGTTYPLIAKGSALSFGPPETNSSLPGAFCIDATSTDFTAANAINNNYLIGIGNGQNGAQPLASFVPQPGVTYQIQPINTFYVCFGSYTPGALINVKMVGIKCTADFTTTPKTTINIVHNAKGQLIVQTS